MLEPLNVTRSSRYLTTVLASSMLLVGVVHADLVNVNVPGTSNPWLAGMPDGSTAIVGDQAPAQSPVLVSGIPVSGGWVYSFSNVSGLVTNDDATDEGGPFYYGPDGNADGVLSHEGAGSENGIATLRAPINSLMGVFLDDSQPDGTPAPAGLDFESSASRDYLALWPSLKQPFFIGDGLTSGDVIQQIIAPDGATRFFLGTMDGSGWNNNAGSFTVDVSAVPVPGAALLCVLGLGYSSGRLRRHAAV